ncbi:hypothetical protein [Novosphingobium terrae]|uniref:hypothetical protein n=1 Tax=Novosphingobium terrae TaxID=2726189 RepID=UPI00197FE504|nr:hypothetical protein [Novosphingobium terrae]
MITEQDTERNFLKIESIASGTELYFERHVMLGENFMPGKKGLTSAQARKNAGFGAMGSARALTQKFALRGGGALHAAEAGCSPMTAIRHYNNFLR